MRSAVGLAIVGAGIGLALEDLILLGLAVAFGIAAAMIREEEEEA
jgi:hypothetical protein